MIYRLDNVYDADGNSVFDQIGLKRWGPHVALGDAVRLEKKWRPLALEMHHGKGRRLPDLTMLTEYALIASERAWKSLSPLLGKAVEVLPLRSWGPRWMALNVVEVVDGLDRRHSRFSGDETDWDRAEPVLVPASVEGRPIFKLAGVINSPVFVSEEFRKIVEGSAYEGLRFVPIRPAKKSARTQKPAAPAKKPRVAAPVRITDEPMERALRAELGIQAAAALKLVRHDAGDRPGEIVAAILAHVDRLHASRKKAPAGRDLALACLWGDQVCRELGWKWVRVRSGGGSGAIGIVSPKRHHVIYPLPYFQKILADRQGDNTILLLFNMLVAGNVPPARARQYVEFQ